jgi:hypothetical protein
MAIWKCKTGLYYGIMFLKIGIVLNNFIHLQPKPTKMLKLIATVVTGHVTGIITQNT